MQRLDTITRDTHEEDKRRPTDTPPPRERLQPRGEREILPFNTLCFHTLVEPEVRHSDTEPGDQSRGSGEVGEPGKGNARTAPERHISEEGKASRDSDGHVGQPRARRATEEL